MLSDCKLCYICGKMCPKGMKRLNYYQVHKNKKPKRLKFRKPNGLAAGSAFIISKYIVDRSIISASIFNSAAEKLLALNRAQLKKLGLHSVTWYAGDSNQVLDSVTPEADLVFSCPPYADLEKYSDDPRDLSNMDYGKFKSVYFDIVRKSVECLKPDRFACFVVGDVRDSKGFYYNFVSDTIEAFRAAGMELYNEMILVNTVGSLAVRVRRQFNSGRKVGKLHQNVLVFYKGDPKKIKHNFPALNLESIVDGLEVESFEN